MEALFSCHYGLPIRIRVYPGLRRINIDYDEDVTARHSSDLQDQRKRDLSDESRSQRGNPKEV